MTVDVFHANITGRNRHRPGSVMAKDAVKGPASYFPAIEPKYGRPIAEWKELIRGQSGEKHMELVNWLKQEHGMGHGHANALVADTLRE